MRETTVITTGSGGKPRSISYTAYGHTNTSQTRTTSLLYNGELYLDGIYLLGLGYRAYNPILMRFYSSDEYSPFGAGGINNYAYCSADPINFLDPDGRWKREKPRVGPKTRPTPARPPSQGPSINSTSMAINSQSLHAERSRSAGNLHSGQGRPPHQSDNFRQRWSRNHPQPNNPQNKRSYDNRVARLPDSVDPLVYRRGTPQINGSEAGILRKWNATNTRPFAGMSVKWSKDARSIVIEARAVGLNPMDELRKAFENWENHKLRKITYSVDRYVAELRDPTKSTR